MLFGLTNVPATFQAYINRALRDLVDDFCIVYLNDILIFSQSEKEHQRHLELICECLRQAELYAKPSKCVFYKESIEFLGSVITKDGIKMDSERIKTIKDWEAPKTYRDV